jgi:hypothetical protein
MRGVKEELIMLILVVTKPNNLVKVSTLPKIGPFVSWNNLPPTLQITPIPT